MASGATSITLLNGVRGRTVVALEEVLHHDLPVRLDRPFVVRVEAHSVEIDPARSHDRGKVSERLLERGRRRVGIHEDERSPRTDGHGKERETRRVEPWLALERGARSVPSRS